ncbi:MAG TPA: ATP-dependent DNA helicase RecG [Lentimicrobium sp.]|nr:ATP-dependent DNA helicase RecG [Lentimicrobium sp.]
MNPLETSVEFLKGVGPARAELLKKELNIKTINDLILYYPFRYIDRSEIHKISQIESDAAYIQLKGKVISLREMGQGRAVRLSGILEDETGRIELVWFQGVSWWKDKIKPGTEYLIFGKPSLFNGKFNITHPDVDPVEDEKVIKAEPFQPYYYTSEKLKRKGFTGKSFGKIIRNALIQSYGSIKENLNPELIKTFSLLSRADTIANIHFPKNMDLLEKARFRLKFEELFFIQLELFRIKYIRNEKSVGRVFDKIGDNFLNFYNKYLPFELTNAQKKVIKEIRKDLSTGKQMNRLLQGDVGSGKTLVALMTILIAIDNKCQACIMAPTEILANQHYNNIRKFLKDMPVNVRLLTGSTKKSDREVIHADLRNGELNLLIGTHALIEEGVQFKDLGLVIIDEQHRFGVEQRAKLWQKSDLSPHILVMTATPIPRTLAMTVYGDLEVSVIDELPPGRKPIKTFHFYEKDRLRVFQFMKEQIKEGRQIYVVYPLINESDKVELQALMDGFDTVSRYFPLPDYQISIVHGQLKASEKESEMKRFLDKKTQIMVATTVIEVGVDVPNATVMVIENAERFGLSQLHQLRGRVGRGGSQSFCVLLSSYKLTGEGRKRLETMVETNDGFEIAEVDLRLRGPGDIQGTQQSGLIGLRIADIVRDEEILKKARKAAIDIINKDPELIQPENQKMVDYLMDRNKKWGQIS